MLLVSESIMLMVVMVMVVWLAGCGRGDHRWHGEREPGIFGQRDQKADQKNKIYKTQLLLSSTQLTVALASVSELRQQIFTTKTSMLTC